MSITVRLRPWYSPISILNRLRSTLGRMAYSIIKDLPWKFRKPALRLFRLEWSDADWDDSYLDYLHQPYPPFDTWDEWAEAGYELSMEENMYSPEHYKIACEMHAMAEPAVKDTDQVSRDDIPF